MQLKGDFEDLLQLLQPDAAAVAKEDLERIKKEVFGPQTFFVTESMTHLDPGGLVGVMIRGKPSSTLFDRARHWLRTHGLGQKQCLLFLIRGTLFGEC